MKKINKFKVMAFTFLATFLMKTQNTFASLSIDTDTISKEFSPIQSGLLTILGIFCMAVSGVSLIQDYIASRIKDEEEREQTPFWKICKKHILDLVLLGVGLIILAAIKIKF